MTDGSLHTVYLSLGANIGDRRATLLRAVDMLGELCGNVARLSSFIETEPWGFNSPHRFLNAAAMLLTPMTPHDLLHATQQIERELGRTAKSDGNGYKDRPIDIDILTYDDLHIATPELTLPHPRMAEREFVMLPLREIASEV